MWTGLVGGLFCVSRSMKIHLSRMSAILSESWRGERRREAGRNRWRQKGLIWPDDLFHRAAAAFLAMARRVDGFKALARATPPFDAPSFLRATAAGLRVSRGSSASPVAIGITRTAFPMTSAGRRAPGGVLGLFGGADQTGSRAGGRPEPGPLNETATRPNRRTSADTRPRLQARAPRAKSARLLRPARPIPIPFSSAIGSCGGPQRLS